MGFQAVLSALKGDPRTIAQEEWQNKDQKIVAIQQLYEGGYREVSRLTTMATYSSPKELREVTLITYRLAWYMILRNVIFALFKQTPRPQSFKQPAQ